MLYQKNLRPFNKNTFLIESVSAPYRYQEVWIDDWVKSDGSPKRKCTKRETVIIKDWKFFIKEWNADEKKFIERPFTEKIDKEFFKSHKKKYDIKIRVEKDIEINVWDKDSQSMIDKEDTEFTITWLSDFMLKEMLLQTDIVEEEPMDWDNKVWDWEEKEVEWLIGKFIKVTITWQKLDTRYKFRQWKAFEVEETAKEDDVEEDMLF